jgi:hypothetical protein
MEPNAEFCSDTSHHKDRARGGGGWVSDQGHNWPPLSNQDICPLGTETGNSLLVCFGQNFPFFEIHSSIFENPTLKNIK